MPNSMTVDRSVRYSLWLIALLVMCIPGLILWELLNTGALHLSLSFITQAPAYSGREGGILPIIMATLLILLVCLAVVIPLGTTCALYLNEYANQAHILHRGLDILNAVPSIVYGLFGYIFFTEILKLGFSILSGGLTLACMVLPLFIRMAELALSHCPTHYRQAAHALAISHWGFIWKILLPNCSSALAAATIISIGRALAETAVLIFTAGYVTRMPSSVFDSGRSLSVHIYDLAMNVPGGTAAASATALVLICLLILLNIAAKKLGQHWIRPSV